MASVGHSAGVELDDLNFAIAEGDSKAIERQLDLNLAETAPIMILRGLARHFLKLHGAVGRLESGASLQDAMIALNSPLFWRDRPRLEKQCRRWSSRAIAPRAAEDRRNGIAGHAPPRDRRHADPARGAGDRGAAGEALTEGDFALNPVRSTTSASWSEIAAPLSSTAATVRGVVGVRPRVNSQSRRRKGGSGRPSGRMRWVAAMSLAMRQPKPPCLHHAEQRFVSVAAMEPGPGILRARRHRPPAGPRCCNRRRSPCARCRSSR